ncbi:MAG: integrase arm-type DNA-binding domain-containing protein [Alphaproteobacteria bacterium]
MPKIAKELSATEVRRLTQQGVHAVGGVSGLLLQVTDTGARSWILRTKIGPRRREIGLGGFPEVPLATARDKAREAKELIRNGVDPIAQRRAARVALIAADGKAITFKEAAEKFLGSKTAEFKNAKHAAQWGSTLATYAYPTIGKLPVDAVELAHVVKVLERIWANKTETATRLRGRIEAVLSWATVSGFRSGDNPARWRGNLDAVLPKPTKLKNVKHHAAVPWRDVAAFMVKLRKRDGMAARALEFLILTAARSGEVRGATWAEIDLERKVWTVPGDRMKAGKEHVVPLCDDAVALLKELPRMEDSNLVFPAPRGGQLSDMTLAAVMRRMKVAATVHGFRSTFRDWTAEATAYPHEVCEMALAHTVGSTVERAYRRGDMFAKRARLMADWCKFVNTPAAKSGDVVAMRKGRG